MITLANGKKVLPAHIVNEFDCGCVIVSEFTAGAGCKIIEYCPIHAAAPDLLQACEQIDEVATLARAAIEKAKATT